MGFDYRKTDANVRYYYTDGKWSEMEVTGDEYIKIHMSASCLHYGIELFEGLKAFRGVDGKVRLLSLIDPGPDFRMEYRERIADMRLFLEFFRRVQIPYYEEARLYWGRAQADGYFAGANEIWTYLPRNLKTLIEEYSDDE